MYWPELLFRADGHLGIVAGRILPQLGHGAAMVVVDEGRIVLYSAGRFRREILPREPPHRGDDEGNQRRAAEKRP